jgi:hypothetical protein
LFNVESEDLVKTVKKIERKAIEIEVPKAMLSCKSLDLLCDVGFQILCEMLIKVDLGIELSY